VHDPLFVYLKQSAWPVGSAYKYYNVLQTHFGGVMLKSQRDIAVVSDFREDIKELKPALIFCRGDWLRYYEIAIEQKVPYILIEQDVHSLRTKLKCRQVTKEKIMIEKAAGIIFTSKDHVAYCQSVYKVPANYVVIHLRPLKQDLAWAPKEKLPGKNLVYAGGLIESTVGGNYGYRCYKSIFKAFTDAGWTIHLYASKNQYSTVRSYATDIENVVPHGWLPYTELLQEMSQYTAGLQAYAKVGVKQRQFAYTQTCRPNKTWDYLAAGIPTIGLYHGNCAKIYLDGGWGVTIPDTKQSTLENIKLPSFPDSLRYEQVMENDLPLFKQVIDKALAEKKEKPIHITKEKKGEEEDMADAKHLWHRLTKPVVENGRLLHGRGKRIPIREAIRLGLVKKEVIVKKKIKKRIEKKKAKIETKPLVDEKKGGSFKKAFEETKPIKKTKKRTKKDELKALTATVKVIEKLKVEED